MLDRIIEARAANLERMYELSGGVAHDGEKGAFREYFVSELIRPFIPDHFGIGSGIVLAFDGKMSNQTDLIIYDRRLLRPVLLAGERGLFPIDSVLAVVEVKSCLEARHYVSLANAASCYYPPSDLNPSGLMIATPGRLPAKNIGVKHGRGKKGTCTIWPLFAVFAYTSDAKKKNELQRLKENVPDHSDKIRLIGVLDKGVWSYESAAWIPRESSSKGRNAICFLRALLNRLENTARSRGAYRLQDWLSD